MTKQIMLEQGNKVNRQICRELRKNGFNICVSSLGNQVTSMGLIKTTMVTIFNYTEQAEYIIKKQDFLNKGI